MPKKLVVEVWSDIACPWCYVGKRRLEAALAQFPHRAAVEVVWRAFELDPGAPAERDTSQPYAERLARKYGTQLSQAKGMIERMVQVASSDGLHMDFERIRPGNTFQAHRLLHLAKERGCQDALKERLFRAYLSEGQPIGDVQTLARLAREVGLDDDEVQGLFATDLHASEVRREQREAHDIGITGVPFFLLGRRLGVAGAQPAELLLGALTKAWDELPDTVDALDATGPVCGPEGCA